MSGSNSTPEDNWVRLNVGGKIFETTQETLTRHPESFLARLVNGGLPSKQVFENTKSTLTRHPKSFLARFVKGGISNKQDISGAFLIDRSYEHFDTILNYLRTGSANFDRSEKAMKDLLCEADFYNIKPLMDEIRKAMSATNRSEIIMLFVDYCDDKDDTCRIVCSETHKDYEVLQALRDKFNDVRGKDGVYGFSMPRILSLTRIAIEVVLHNFGFVEESYDGNYRQNDGSKAKYWKFVRTVSK